MKKALLFLPLFILAIAFVHAENLTIVSDTSTQYYGSSSWNSASAVASLSPSWVANVNIPGAVWIWNSPSVTSDEAVNGGTVSFRREIDLPDCAKNFAGTITITTDNAFTLKFNSDAIGSSDNWYDIKTYNISSSLRPGTNFIYIDAINDAMVGGTPETNPAGVLYRADITYDKYSCGHHNNSPQESLLPGAVTGTVYDQAHNNVSGATVTVICNNVTESTTSNIDGDYYVTFAPGICYFNDPVTVNAVKGSASGSNEGNMCSGEDCEIPVALVDVTVPEFGVIAGAVALIGALGIFVYKRKN